MTRMPRVLAAIIGSHPVPPPAPIPVPPLPVPPPAVTVTSRPPYRTCKPCGVGWRGDDGCWSPTHNPEGTDHE